MIEKDFIYSLRHVILDRKVLVKSIEKCILSCRKGGGSDFRTDNKGNCIYSHVDTHMGFAPDKPCCL